MNHGQVSDIRSFNSTQSKGMLDLNSLLGGDINGDHSLYQYQPTEGRESSVIMPMQYSSIEEMNV